MAVGEGSSFENTIESDSTALSGSVIGIARGRQAGLVTMTTAIGGTRVVDMLSGEQLPRIC